MWIGTETGGLNRFDPKKAIFTSCKRDPGNADSLSSNSILVIHIDQSNTLWLGTWGGGLNKFDREKETFTHYRYQSDNPNSLSHDDVFAICEDRVNRLWLGTWGGGLNKFDPGKETFVHYQFSPGSPHGLSSNFIMGIYIDRADVLWIGTEGGGLNKYDPGTGTFTHYTTKNGLPDNVVCGILEDERGNLWLSTYKGLSRFDPSTGIFKNYDFKSGVQGYEYNTGAFYKSRSGEMFFGGVNGFNSFYPVEIEDNPYIPPIVFTDFKIFNKHVDIDNDSRESQGTRDARLKKHIGFTDEIILSHKDKIFSLEFAALDYTNSPKNKYMYMVEGLHKDWVYLSHKHEVNFTGLDPGEYILRVKGSNNDGVWNQEGASLKIIITPPFWQTWWFRTLCVVTLLALIFAWHQNRMKNLSLQLKTEAEMERIFEKHNITYREKQVVHLILEGKSNKEIEDTLYISIRTVKNHVYNIYRKFGVNSRLELIHSIQKSIKVN
jgi:DNA-binding CsgD family transcriptional regulator/streptogramin lyase